jgi:hypothetical protein
MLVMAAMLLAGTTFLTISSTEGQIAINERALAQATLLAQAGVERAMAQLAANSSYGGESNVAVAGGLVGITVSVSGVQPCGGAARDIVATGTMPVPGGGAAVAQVAATVDRVTYPFRWAAFATVPNTVVSGGTPIAGVDRTEKELWLRRSVTVDSYDSTFGAYDATTNRSQAGHVGSNGDIALESGAVVNGAIWAGDTIVAASTPAATGVVVSGMGTEAADARPYPSVAVVPMGPLLPGGSPATLSGPATVDGRFSYQYSTVTVSGATITVVNGPLTIQATGDVSINGLTLNGTATLLGAGNVTLQGAFTLNGSLTIQSAGTVSLPANLTILGSPLRLTAGTLSLSSSVTVAGPATIVVTGNTAIGDNVTFGTHPPTQLQLLLPSNDDAPGPFSLTAGNAFTFRGSLYGKHTNVIIGSFAAIHGSVIARTIAVGSAMVGTSGALHYDQQLSQRELCHGGAYGIRRGTWREIVP